MADGPTCVAAESDHPGVHRGYSAFPLDQLMSQCNAESEHKGEIHYCVLNSGHRQKHMCYYTNQSPLHIHEWEN